jgi:hypothetical protein
MDCRKTVSTLLGVKTFNLTVSVCQIHKHLNENILVPFCPLVTSYRRRRTFKKYLLKKLETLILGTRIKCLIISNILLFAVIM